MVKKRTGEPWISADDYGKGLPPFTVNLIVRDIVRSVDFYERVLGATVGYSDPDFAVLNIAEVEFMLHADHTYDDHPWYERFRNAKERGAGAELRLFGLDPDAIEARARAQGATIVVPSMDTGHGWRELMVADPDGYLWAAGRPI